MRKGQIEHGHFEWCDILKGRSDLLLLPLPYVLMLPVFADPMLLDLYAPPILLSRPYPTSIVPPLTDVLFVTSA